MNILATNKFLHEHLVSYQNLSLLFSAAALLPYFGSLRLSTTNSTSNGLLQLYAYGEWRPVCYTGMSIQAVNTSCKQMGYTSALEYTKRFETQSNCYHLTMSQLGKKKQRNYGIGGNDGNGYITHSKLYKPQNTIISCFSET